jgi:transposase
VGEVKKGVRIVFCDEMRYGLISNRRRGWSKRGKQRPLIPSGMEYEFGYMYIGVDIESWKVECLLLPDANCSTTKMYLEFLRQKCGAEEVVIVWDGAGYHRSGKVKGIEKVRFVTIPAYSPQLNPVERLIEELRKSTANRVFNNIEEIEEVLIEALKEYIENRDKVERLCGFPWIKRQLEEMYLTT